MGKKKKVGKKQHKLRKYKGEIGAAVLQFICHEVMSGSALGVGNKKSKGTTHSWMIV